MENQQQKFSQTGSVGHESAYPSSTALVLEGGSYRGIFTAGILDVLREKGVTNFESVWGVSAGAINAVSFRSKQMGRAMRIMLAFRDDPRFLSLRSLITTGDIACAEFMFDEIQNHLDPCDNEEFNQNPMQMYVVASDVTFGTSAYLHVKKFPEDIAMIRASTAMPTVSRIVELDGHRYLDGGTTDSIPFAAALGLPDGKAERAVDIPDHKPAKKALVIVTQDRNFVKTDTNEQFAIRSQLYSAYPYFETALASRAERCRCHNDRIRNKGIFRVAGFVTIRPIHQHFPPDIFLISQKSLSACTVSCFSTC